MVWKTFILFTPILLGKWSNLTFVFQPPISHPIHPSRFNSCGLLQVARIFLTLAIQLMNTLKPRNVPNRFLFSGSDVTVTSSAMIPFDRKVRWLDHYVWFFSRLFVGLGGFEFGVGLKVSWWFFWGGGWAFRGVGRSGFWTCFCSDCEFVTGKLLLQEIHPKIKMGPYPPTDPVQEVRSQLLNLLRFFRGPFVKRGSDRWNLSGSQFRVPQRRGLELVCQQRGDSGFAISSPETTLKNRRNPASPRDLPSVNL